MPHLDRDDRATPKPRPMDLRDRRGAERHRVDPRETLGRTEGAREFGADDFERYGGCRVVESIERRTKVVRKCVDASGQVVAQFGVDPAQRAQRQGHAPTGAGVALGARALSPERAEVGRSGAKRSARERP